MVFLKNDKTVENKGLEIKKKNKCAWKNISKLLKS